MIFHSDRRFWDTYDVKRTWLEKKLRIRVYADIGSIKLLVVRLVACTLVTSFYWCILSTIGRISVVFYRSVVQVKTIISYFVFTLTFEFISSFRYVLHFNFSVVMIIMVINLVIISSKCLRKLGPFVFVSFKSLLCVLTTVFVVIFGAKYARQTLSIFTLYFHYSNKYCNTLRTEECINVFALTFLSSLNFFGLIRTLSFDDAFRYGTWD